jgi:DNA-binding transcriptional regulator YiaG
MGKIENTLKAEITRLARKELRTAVGSLSKRVGELRQRISQLSKMVAKMDNAAARKTQGRMAEGQPQAASNVEIKAARITGRVIRNIRRKLGITQEKLALLLEVSPGAVAFWEQGRARPRGANKAAIVALRKLGRRDVRRLLTEKGVAAKSRKAK